MRYLTTAQTAEWQSCVDSLPEEMRDVHLLPGMMAPYEAACTGIGCLYVNVVRGEFVIQPMLFDKENKVRHPHNFGGPASTPDYVGPVADVDFCTLNPFMAERQLALMGHTAEYEKDVVWVDLTKELTLRGTTRRLVEKSDIDVFPVFPIYMTVFAKMYKESMERHNAEAHWRFSKAWFEALEKMAPNVQLLFAQRGGLVAGCLLLHGYGTCYYHLAASYETALPGDNHRMVYKAMCWARDNGYKRFHLGGGVTPRDGLYTFKSGFSDLRLPVYRYKASEGREICLVA